MSTVDRAARLQYEPQIGSRYNHHHGTTTTITYPHSSHSSYSSSSNTATTPNMTESDMIHKAMNHGGSSTGNRVSFVPSTNAAVQNHNYHHNHQNHDHKTSQGHNGHTHHGNSSANRRYDKSIEQKAQDLMKQIEQKVRRELNIPQIPPEGSDGRIESDGIDDMMNRQQFPYSNNETESNVVTNTMGYDVNVVDGHLVNEFEDTVDVVDLSFNQLDAKERELQQELMMIDNLLTHRRNEYEQQANPQQLNQNRNVQTVNSTTTVQRKQRGEQERERTVAMNRGNVSRSFSTPSSTTGAKTVQKRPLSAQRGRTTVSSSSSMVSTTSTRRPSSASRVVSSSSRKTKLDSHIVDDWYFGDSREEKVLTQEVNKVIDKLERQILPRQYSNLSLTSKRSSNSSNIKSVSVQLKHLLIQDEELKRVRQEIEAISQDLSNKFHSFSS